MAVRALQTAGLKSFTIDIGQVAYFKALVSGLELGEAQTDALRRAVDSKNVVEIEAMAEQLGITGRRKQRLLALPNLFGGAGCSTKRWRCPMKQAAARLWKT